MSGREGSDTVATPHCLCFFHKQRETKTTSYGHGTPWKRTYWKWRVVGSWVPMLRFWIHCDTYVPEGSNCSQQQTRGSIG